MSGYSVRNARSMSVQVLVSLFLFWGVIGALVAFLIFPQIALLGVGLVGFGVGVLMVLLCRKAVIS